MTEPLRDAVVRHVETRALDARRLRRLDHLQSRRRRPPWWKHPRLGWAVACGLMAALLTGWLLRPGEVPLSERIAREVAANHLKLKPLEVQTADMDRIRAYFEELDFVPVHSELLASGRAELIGGRYCSIQGVTAAQLRVRGPEGRGLSTLYQAPYDPERHRDLPKASEGEPPLTLWAQGMPVQIWVEKGVLFALTGAPQGTGPSDLEAGALQTPRP